MFANLFKKPEIKKSKKIFNEENRVIIRIWTSEYNKVLTGKDVGHISIEMINYYASLWPLEGVPNSPKALLTSPPAIYPENYKCGKDSPGKFCCDFHLEARIPELTICLYGLKVGNMEDKFSELKRDTQNWHILGNNIFARNQQESCVSLAWKILNAGGLISSTSEKSSYSSIVAPDFLLSTLVKAKFQEIEESEDVKKFVYSDELSIEKLEELNNTFKQQKAPLKKLSVF